MHGKPVPVFLDESPHYLCAMSGQTIPEQHQAAPPETPLEIAENRKHLLFPHPSFGEPRERGCSFVCGAKYNHACGSDSFPPAARANDRCLSPKAPCPHDMRAVGKTRFVKKAKYRAIFQAPFFTVGHVLWSHVLIAFSSRSTARLAGF